MRFSERAAPAGRKQTNAEGSDNVRFRGKRTYLQSRRDVSF
jgi:hypothetical protein